MRIIPMPPRPAALAIAAMVSCSVVIFVRRQGAILLRIKTADAI